MFAAGSASMDNGDGIVHGGISTNLVAPDG